MEQLDDQYSFIILIINNHLKLSEMKKLIPVIFLFSILACTQKSVAPKVDFKAEEQAVRELSIKWLELNRNHDFDAIAALFTDDGIAYRQNQEPKVGLKAIKDYHIQDFEQNPKTVADWKTDRVEITASGDLAIEYGSWHDTGRGPDGTGDDQGKYVTLYRKVNGAWKVATDISVSTNPVAPVK
jgi:uncharacterized protein (TIGR02246 family)